MRIPDNWHEGKKKRILPILPATHFGQVQLDLQEFAQVHVPSHKTEFKAKAFAWCMMNVGDYWAHWNNYGKSEVFFFADEQDAVIFKLVMSEAIGDLAS